MKTCTSCLMKSKEVLSIDVRVFSGEDIRINLCINCINKIIKKEFFIFICQNCKKIISPSNEQKNDLQLVISDDCFLCLGKPVRTAPITKH